MSLVNKRKLALSIIVAEFALNVWMRTQSYHIELYGNIICLLLLSTVCILITTGINKIGSIIALGYMASILPDTLFFMAPEMGANDLLFLVGWAGATLDYALREKPRKNLNGGIVVLLLAVIIKAVSRHSYEEINGYSVYVMGDAITHFLLACVILWELAVRYPVIPGILFAGTLVDMIDSTVWETYNPHTGEYVIMGLVGLNILWWLLRKWLAKTSEAKRLFFHIYIAMQVLIVAGFFILFIKSLR